MNRPPPRIVASLLIAALAVCLLGLGYVLGKNDLFGGAPASPDAPGEGTPASALWKKSAAERGNHSPAPDESRTVASSARDAALLLGDLRWHALRMASDHDPLPPEAREILRILARDAPLDALVTLRSMGQDGESMIPDLYRAVAGLDLAAAKSLLAEEETRGLQRPSSAFRERAEVLGAVWARTGPEAAFHWGLTLPSESQSKVIGSILTSAADSAVPVAERLCASLDHEGPSWNAAKTVLAMHIAKTDPGEAIRWYSTLGAKFEVEGKAYILTDGLPRQILQEWATRDPSAATRYLESNPILKAADYRGAVLLGGAVSDPVMAAAGAASLTEEEAASLAEQGLPAAIVRSWFERDSVAASEWVRSQPPGNFRDRAAQQLVSKIVDSDPEAAIEWALTIKDPGHRRNILAELAEKEIAAPALRKAMTRLSAEDAELVTGRLNK